MSLGTPLVQQGPHTGPEQGVLSHGLTDPVTMLSHLKTLRQQKLTKNSYNYFSHSQALQFRSQQRPPTRVVVDKEGKVTGITRPYINHRLTWYATRALRPAQDLQARIKNLATTMSEYPKWVDTSTKYWLTREPKF